MTSTTLKVITLLLMFLDHIGTFIQGAPIWFKWIGRISAPLFIFTMVWGLHYTRDRKKYLKNMYLWGVGMSIGDVIVSTLLPNAHSIPSNNIFVTLFLIGCISTAIELIKNKKRKEGWLLLSGLVVVQIIGFVLIDLVQKMMPTIPTMYFVVVALLPNIIHCEGMFVVIIVGVALYFAKQLKPMYFSLVYTIVSIMMFISQEVTFSFDGLLNQNYQWMMIAALPLMLYYNGKKGKNLKWLFYIFYPTHIYLLCWLGTFIQLK